jgi:hypothetical protein
MKQTTNQRLDELLHAPDDWYSGASGCPRPSVASVARARKWLRWFPRGHVYPCIDGGIQWEYDWGRWALTLEFNQQGLIDFSVVEVKLA